MFLPILAMLLAQPPLVLEGEDVRLLAYRNEQGIWVEQLSAKDRKGQFHVILSSPGAFPLEGDWRSGAVQGASRGLYTTNPDLRFTEATTSGRTVTLTSKSPIGTFKKSITVPAKGRTMHLTLDADFGVKRTQLHALLLSYAFAPDNKAARPDSTFLPGLRPKDENVVGDHFFRAPAAVAQKGKLAAILLPDLDVLADNRPMETVLDLDVKNGVSSAPLLTYGFAAHRLSGHVAFSTDSSMLRNVPGQLHLASDLILNAEAEPLGAYEEATKFEWERYGHKNFDKIRPQMMPFVDYANVCYPAAFDEHYGDNKLGWFETTIEGQVCGGIPSGWGFDQGWVSWQCWFNQLRSAWGLHWWGRKLSNKDWLDKSDKMLNLALAAPMDRGAVPTTYLSREKKWRGSLIMPDPRCYYDLTNMAWKGIWMLRWLDFADCPRREEILKQVNAMADLMVSKQNADGSLPSWLDKDLKVVPILDHSAQTALPAWFLGELALADRTRIRAALDAEGQKIASAKDQEEVEAIRQKRLLLLQEDQKNPREKAAYSAALFLMKNVVDQQRYYDFETFFSCSPKQCLQVNGVIDADAMHDPHSMSPPQNTLCMQWAAEALLAAKQLYLGHPALDMSNPAALEEAKNSVLAEVSQTQLESSADKALSIMALYQNVWPISYRKAAYTFGGFGVQNSDGEYNDARQAQFGCTMADYGAATGKQDWFERGIAATRASLALINHPLHSENGIYPNPNYPYGLEPENTGHGGTDEQDGRTGFDWGEGSGLASMAWLLDKYGAAYIDEKHGWKVGIDGVKFDTSGTKLGFMVPTRSFIFSTGEVRDSAGQKRNMPVEIVPQVNGMPFASEDGHLGITFPLRWVHSSKTFPAQIIFADGSSVRALGGAFGASEGSGSVQAQVTAAQLAQPFQLKANVEGWPVESDFYRLYVNPSWIFDDYRMPGWQVEGKFAEVPTYSQRTRFGVSRDEGFVGTCEDGAGGFDDSYTGTITSPIFTASKPNIHLLVGGGSGEGVYVELLAYQASPPGGAFDKGQRVAIWRGTNREQMSEVVFDARPYRHQFLQFRIVDNEKGGWGHINVGRIRVTD